MDDKNVIKTLIIEDNPGDAYLLKEYLKNTFFNTYDIDKCESLSEGLKILSTVDIQVIILDLGLPDTVELEGLKKLTNKFPDLCIIVVTGNNDLSLARKAVMHGAQDYLTKGKLDSELLDKTLAFALERKSLQQELYNSNREIFSLINNIPGTVFKAKIENNTINIIYISKYIKIMTGYSDIDFIEGLHSMDKLIHEQDFQDVMVKLKKSYNYSERFEIEFRIITKDNNIKWVSVRGNFLDFKTPFEDANMEAVMIDITDQVQAEEKQLSIALSVEDRERSRISREIHDGLQQTLITSLMSIESIEEDITVLNKKSVSRFNKGLKYLNQGIKESIDIAYRLIPKAVFDFGYVTATENLLNNLREKFTFDFEHNLGKNRLPYEIEIALFRITQEALNNIVKYSNAKTLYVRLIYSDEILNLSIEDDGVGFDLSAKNSHEPGMGINSMKARATSLGGVLEINSNPGNGTFIMVDIPLKWAMK